MDLIIKYITSILEMLTANVENMLVTSIDTTLGTGVVPTQYIIIISTGFPESEVGIQRWINVGPIVNFCLGNANCYSLWVNQVFIQLILPD